ncbi:MAG: nodulation protein [Methylocystaceae bacterium]|nr:MAG: nodulation protein [Methylocystaceae bacterium]
MNLSAPFVQRPVATTLLTIAVALAGALAAFRLPAAPMPEFDYPVISVVAQMAGASPEVMATTVATPLERRLAMIADVTEVRSFNSYAASVVTLGFGVGRNIDGAARDVQAAVDAARSDLPTSLRSNPMIYKSNSAFWPITYLSLTSATMNVDQIYDTATTTLRPLLASIRGVGDVVVLGSSPFAVRVEANPDALTKYALDFEGVRAAIISANSNSPKGEMEGDGRRLQIYANDRVGNAKDLRELVVAYRQGQTIRLADVAEVTDSVEDFRPFAITGRDASILIRVYRTSGANVIETVDRIQAKIDEIRATLPPAIDIALVSDRTATIRASLHDLEHSLIIGLVLVVLVVFLFLRSVRATLVPAVAAAVSLLGTAVVMYLMQYSLDNVSLMALIIAVGLVVDDSVVVLENISRHLESGAPKFRAVLEGVKEVGFTVVAISLSLVAIFIPFLFAGDVIGRVLAEFAVTLSAAILISLIVSLTTSPMLCSVVLHRPHGQRRRSTARYDPALGATLRFYDATLTFALRHSRWTLAMFLAVFGFGVYLYVVMPKGLLPEQDPGRLYGALLADQNVSASAIRQKLERAAELILADASIKSFAAVIEDRARRNSAELYVELKPRPERTETVHEVNARLTEAVSRIAGTTLRLIAPQDISAFSSQASKGRQYQYDLRGDDVDELQSWAVRLVERLGQLPEIREPEISPQAHALEASVIFDRDKAHRLGVTVAQIDNTLYDAFGQRQISIIHTAFGQYRVVMEVAPRYREDPDILNNIYVSSSGAPVSGVLAANTAGRTILTRGGTASEPRLVSATVDKARYRRFDAIESRAGARLLSGAAVSLAPEAMIPLSTIAHFERKTSSLSVSHIGASVAMSIAFDVPPTVSLGDAVTAIERAAAEIHMPASIQGGFSGAAAVFQKLIVKEGLLMLAAFATVYVVLGVLYESFIHPLTVLSTLPAAGSGAIFALIALRMDFTIVAFIGVILLTGIVMKNAIMMIDVAIRIERQRGLSARHAIRQACLLRFRPIMMTTAAAILGAVPLVFGAGEGAELRQPLGISIVGGLVVSQALTLYTTPVIYLYLDRFRRC